MWCPVFHVKYFKADYYCFCIPGSSATFWTPLLFLNSSPACTGTECPELRRAIWDSVTNLTASPGYSLDIAEDAYCAYVTPDLTDATAIRVEQSSSDSCQDPRGIVCSGSCDTGTQVLKQLHTRFIPT